MKNELDMGTSLDQVTCWLPEKEKQMPRYFIDYDNNDTSAVDEIVDGDIIQHITDALAKMFSEGVYRDGNKDSDTHSVSYALNEKGVSWKNRHELDWQEIYVDVERDEE